MVRARNARGVGKRTIDRAQVHPSYRQYDRSQTKIKRNPRFISPTDIPAAQEGGATAGKHGWLRFAERPPARWLRFVAGRRRGFVRGTAPRWLRFVAGVRRRPSLVPRSRSALATTPISSPVLRLNSFPCSAWECRPGRSASSSGPGRADAERRRRHSHGDRGNELRWLRSGRPLAAGLASFGETGRARRNWLRSGKRARLAEIGFVRGVQIVRVVKEHADGAAVRDHHRADRGARPCGFRSRSRVGASPWCR